MVKNVSPFPPAEIGVERLSGKPRSNFCGGASPTIAARRCPSTTPYGFPDSLLFHDREDLVLAEDQQFLSVDLDFGAGPPLKEDAIPFADLVRYPAA